VDGEPPCGPELFQRELETTVAAVASSPMLGAVSADDEFPDVRRVLMRRTRYHVYYRIIGDVLEVLAIWHAARGEGPTLG
jgi:plasmid stabilization system protein ParE